MIPTFALDPVIDRLSVGFDAETIYWNDDNSPLLERS
jgi:hypothetical protein